MAKYRYEVEVLEVWARTIAIEADDTMTKAQLQAKANQVIEEGCPETEGEAFEYDRTLDTDTWPVKCVEEDGKEVLEWLQF